MHDNRNYVFKKEGDSARPEYAWIVSQIPRGASVIDLGCGEGSLLSLLHKEKSIKGFGIEIAPSGVAICKKRGLNVRQGRIDEHLSIDDKKFDYAVCNVTLQMVMYPEVLMREMARISKYQIISLPNFAFIKNRWELLFGGKMPQAMLFGYKWYDTGHVHQLSLKDFEEFCQQNHFVIMDKYFLSGIPGNRLIDRWFYNIFAMVAIYKLKSEN